jgi:hypothetical protein
VSGDGTAYPLLARLSNMIFEGDLATTMRQLGDDSRLINLRFYDRVELRDVEARWASQMGLTFGDCNQVRGSRLHLHHIARDGVNASNCADFAVTNSDFAFIIDDCCAANLSAVTPTAASSAPSSSPTTGWSCAGSAPSWPPPPAALPHSGLGLMTARAGGDADEVGR